MAKGMRKLLTGIVVTIMLVLAVLWFAPRFIPAEAYKQQVISTLETATGRNVSITGPIQLQFLPTVKLSLANVRLGNPQGFQAVGDADMASLKELQLSLDAFALLSNRVVIDEFKLVEPVIHLERNVQGQDNWTFTPKKAQSASPETGDAASASFGGDVQLPHLEILNGTFSYREAPKAEPLLLGQVNAKINLPSMQEALTLHAEAQWNGTLPITLDARVYSLAEWGAGRPVAMDADVKLKDDLATLSLQSKITPVKKGSSPTVEGDVLVSSSSLKALGKALDKEILPETVKTEGKFTLRGVVDFRGTQISLKKLDASLDGMSVTGEVAAKLDGKRPFITADLSSEDVLVLDNFMAENDGKADTSVSPAPEAGWNKAPVMADTSAFKAVDAEIALALGGIKADRLSVGAIQIETVLKNGVLRLTMPECDFYEGKAQAEIIINGAGNALSMSENATLKGIDIGRFLQDANDFDKLAGKGNLTTSLRTQGMSMHDFVNRLSGTAALEMRNGAIKGVNLAQIVREARSVAQAVKQPLTVLTPKAKSETAQTDFADFGARFQLANGIANNRDFSLRAPLLHVTGQGTVNLPQRTVDYHLKPTIIGSIEGQERAQKTSGGLAIPLKVTGSFDALQFTPDAESVIQDVLQDPEGTVKNLKNNFKGLKTDLKSLLKGN